jgi:DNA-binding response OmpR family regulator
MLVVLAGEGFNVIEARTGEEAMAVLQQKIPDVVMLDPGLPDMDGYEISRTIRDDRLMADVQMVVLSDKMSALNKLYGFLSGAKTFIHSPFRPESLIDKIMCFSD